MAAWSPSGFGEATLSQYYNTQIQVLQAQQLRVVTLASLLEVELARQRHPFAQEFLCKLGVRTLQSPPVEDKPFGEHSANEVLGAADFEDAPETLPKPPVSPLLEADQRRRRSKRRRWPVAAGEAAIQGGGYDKEAPAGTEAHRCC